MLYYIMTIFCLSINLTSHLTGNDCATLGQLKEYIILIPSSHVYLLVSCFGKSITIYIM